MHCTLSFHFCVFVFRFGCTYFLLLQKVPRPMRTCGALAQSLPFRPLIVSQVSVYARTSTSKTTPEPQNSRGHRGHNDRGRYLNKIFVLQIRQTQVPWSCSGPARPTTSARPFPSSIPILMDKMRTITTIPVKGRCPRKNKQQCKIQRCPKDLQHVGKKSFPNYLSTILYRWPTRHAHKRWIQKSRTIAHFHCPLWRWLWDATIGLYSKKPTTFWPQICNGKFVVPWPPPYTN